MSTRFTSERLFDGGYAHGARVDSGATLFTAGISPLDASGQIIAPEDPPTQVTVAVGLLGDLIAEHGATTDDIAKLTIYLATTDQADLATVWAAVDTAFSGQAPPSVIVAVTVLPYPGQRVELDAVVAI